MVIVIYLDDILVLGDLREECQKNVDKIIATLEKLDCKVLNFFNWYIEEQQCFLYDTRKVSFDDPPKSSINIKVKFLKNERQGCF